MRHRKKERKFAKSRNQRKALLRNLASSLILKEKLFTTEAKIKELKSFIEKVLTIAKKDTVTNRRLLSRNFSSPKVIKKLFQELAPRYKSRNGGYTRIIKLYARKSDGAKISAIELLK